MVCVFHLAMIQSRCRQCSTCQWRCRHPGRSIVQNQTFGRTGALPNRPLAANLALDTLPSCFLINEFLEIRNITEGHRPVRDCDRGTDATQVIHQTVANSTRRAENGRHLTTERNIQLTSNTEIFGQTWKMNVHRHRREWGNRVSHASARRPMSESGDPKVPDAFFLNFLKRLTLGRTSVHLI